MRAARIFRQSQDEPCIGHSKLHQIGILNICDRVKLLRLNHVFSPQSTLWLKAIAIAVSVRLSVRLSVRKQLPCEHTQGYNSSPIAIIFGMLVWVLIKVGIVYEPYPTRENGPTGLRKKNPLSPFININ